MKDKRLALIFSTVWPEPDSSAAGVRQFHWIHFLLEENYRVVLTSPSKQKLEQDWGSLKLPENVECLPLPLNHSDVTETLRSWAPDLVVFDRFILEEQFGHKVYEACPDALILLETQDLHLVRRSRERVRERYLEEASKHNYIYENEVAIRETAAIERVDYSFVCSSYEEQLLSDLFQIGNDKAKWVPFFYDEPLVESSNARSFSEREDFVWIGNFRHAPNIDGLRWFRNEIWPKIRAELPKARLRIYGAYPSKEVMDWNLPEKTGISVLGSALTLEEVFLKARVNLAPLRFGAGVKGKLLEGFRYGIPAVSTHVGVEGLIPLSSDLQFPGLEANTVSTFANACIELYQNEVIWNQSKEHARALMQGHYDSKHVRPELSKLLKKLLAKKENGELPRWNSRILRHELTNSHKYFSKWIEEKEKPKS